MPKPLRSIKEEERDRSYKIGRHAQMGKGEEHHDRQSRDDRIKTLPAPDTLVTAAVPSDLVPSRKGLLTPRGVDHVLLHVADLEKGVRFYRILYGQEATREKSPERVWFKIGDTRLGLQQAAAGQKPHIEHFAVKVAPFDRGAAASTLATLGGKVVPSPDEPGVLRFTDADGITVEVVSTRT